MSYSLVQRNPNSWVQYADGSRKHDWEADCGHKHRTLEGAVKCHLHFGKINSQLGYFGQIEENETEQPVNEEALRMAVFQVRGY